MSAPRKMLCWLLLGVLCPLAADTALAAPSRAALGKEVIRCGSAKGRRIALTFDDGPSRRHTPRVLEILRRHNVKATFFVVGKVAQLWARLLRRIAAEGHLVANHSWSHPKDHTEEGWVRQIKDTEAAILAAGVKPARFFRPPHGRVSPALLAACRRLGYQVVNYTLMLSDWKGASTNELVHQAVLRAAPGGVLVLHDGGRRRDNMLGALPSILTGLKQVGLKPVRLDRLLGRNPRPGRGCASFKTFQLQRQREAAARGIQVGNGFIGAPVLKLHPLDQEDPPDPDSPEPWESMDPPGLKDDHGS